MIWLDGILAVPAIGIKLGYNFREAAELQKRIPEFIQSLHDKNKNVLIQQTDIWGFVIEIEGFAFKITYKDIHAKFSYFISEKSVAGGIPEYSAPQLRPFSEIVNELIDYMKQILLITKAMNFEYSVIGIVADFSMDPESVPPGLNELLEHLKKPWDGGVSSLALNICANLGDSEKYLERCTHTFSFSEDAKQKGYKCLLDWQRKYKDPQQLIYKNIVNDLSECQKKAFDYYEKFGAGDLNYG